MNDEFIEKAAQFLAAERATSAVPRNQLLGACRHEIRCHLQVVEAIKAAQLAASFTFAPVELHQTEAQAPAQGELLKCTSPGCDWAGPEDLRATGPLGPVHCPRCAGIVFDRMDG